MTSSSADNEYFVAGGEAATSREYGLHATSGGIANLILVTGESEYESPKLGAGTRQETQPQRTRRERDHGNELGGGRLGLSHDEMKSTMYMTLYFSILTVYLGCLQDAATELAGTAGRTNAVLSGEYLMDCLRNNSISSHCHLQGQRRLPLPRSTPQRCSCGVPS